MKNSFLRMIALTTVLLPQLATAETHLIVRYDEAYQGAVYVNGQPIGTLISHGVYNEISEMSKAPGADSEKVDKKALFQQKTGADKAGLKGVGSNLMMDFEVDYILDKHLRPGDNVVSLAIASYVNPEAAKFRYKGRGIKGPDTLEAKLWEVNGEQADLIDYRIVVAKPSANSKYGTEITKDYQRIDLTIKK